VGKFWIGFLGAIVSPCAYAATVTYTLSLNENALGQCAPNSFVIYASASQQDNLGLHSFAADLKTPAQGGAILTSYVNRSPNGTWDADPNDPDFNPESEYPTKYGGFNAVRSVSMINGVVSGAYDSAKLDDAIKIFGFGQQTGNMNDYLPPPAHEPPDFRSVSYKPYAPSTGTDVAYGTTRADLPIGSLRLASGAWAGPIEPSFDTGSVDNKAVLWTGSLPGTVLTVSPEFRTVNYCAVVPEPASGVALLGLVGLVRLRRRARV